MNDTIVKFKEYLVYNCNYSELTAKLYGEDITNLPPHKRPINTVFQRYALFPHLDVYDNVAFGLKLKRVPNEKRPGKVRKLTAEEIDEKVVNALKIVDLEEFDQRLEFQNLQPFLM